MRRIVLFVAYPAVPHFSTLSHKQHDFRKKNFIEEKCVLSLKYFSFFEESSEVLSQMYIRLRVVYLFFVSYFNDLLYRHIFEKRSNFITIFPFGIELFRADGQMDRPTDRRDKANSRF